MVAAYGRSCVVTESNKVYIWGQGFKQEKIPEPRMIFQDTRGIDTLKFGWNYGLYICKSSGQLYSWGDKTFGQTGNNYIDVIMKNDGGDKIIDTSIKAEELVSL